MSIAQRYERNPHKWNLSIVITIGTILWGALVFFVQTEIHNHSVSEQAHPYIVGKLNTIEANQIADQIEKMDARICEARGTGDENYFRKRLRDLIIQWEQMTGKTYPSRLLRCVNGNH